MKKIMIIGASGFVGKHLYDFLREEFEVCGTSYTGEGFDHLDITVKEDLEKYVEDKNPETIIWLSGKDTSFCEKDPIRGFEVNSKALYNLTDILKKNNLNSKIIYVSSDRIFNGQQGFYTEKDVPIPVTNYGFTKKICEQVLGNSGLDYKIIRISAVLGKNGIFFEWLVKKLKNNEKIGLFSNSYFTPTPITLLCENIRNILCNWNIGGRIIHLSGGQKINRFELAEMIAELLDIDNPNIYSEEKVSVFAEDLSLKSSKCIKFRESFCDYLGEELDR